MRHVIALFLFITFTILPALAGTPQISRGVRVMMLPGSIYDEKIKVDPKIWSFFAPSQVEVLEARMTSTPEGQPFTSTNDVLSFFANLPTSIQDRGIWITIMGATPATRSDSERISSLTDGAIQRNLNMYVCKPKRPANTNSWLVAWNCEMVSPRGTTQHLICEPQKQSSASGAPLWNCTELSSQNTPNMTPQGKPASERP